MLAEAALGLEQKELDSVLLVALPCHVEVVRVGLLQVLADRLDAVVLVPLPAHNPGGQVRHRGGHRRQLAVPVTHGRRNVPVTDPQHLRADVAQLRDHRVHKAGVERAGRQHGHHGVDLQAGGREVDVARDVCGEEGVGQLLLDEERLHQVGGPVPCALRRV